MSTKTKWISAGVSDGDLAVALSSGNGGDWFLLIAITGADRRPHQIKVMLGGLDLDAAVHNAGGAAAAIAKVIGVDETWAASTTRDLIANDIAKDPELGPLLVKGLSSGAAGKPAVSKKAKAAPPKQRKTGKGPKKAARRVRR